MAVEGGSIEVVNYLLDNVDYAPVQALRAAIRRNNSEITNLLLKRGDWYQHNYDMELQAAAEGGNLPFIRQYFRDALKGTILRQPATNGHIDIVRFILTKQPENIQDALDNTIKHGHLDIVKLLLPYNSTDWNYVFEMTRRFGQKHTLKEAAKNGVTNWELCLNKALFSEQSKIVKMLAKEGVEISPDGLVVAGVILNNIDMVTRGIEKKVYIGIAEVLIAARLGHTEILLLLLESRKWTGVDIDDILPACVKKSHVEIVWMIFKRYKAYIA